MKPKQRLTDPYQALDLFFFIRHELQEVLAACFLSARNDVIEVREVFRGTIRGTCASPREILQIALKTNAAGLLIAHNHPSGDLTPSPEDLSFTENLNQASGLMGISMVDHLIVGPVDSFYSITLEQMFHAKYRQRSKRRICAAASRPEPAPDRST